MNMPPLLDGISTDLPALDPAIGDALLARAEERARLCVHVLIVRALCRRALRIRDQHLTTAGDDARLHGCHLPRHRLPSDAATRK